MTMRRHNEKDAMMTKIWQQLTHDNDQERMMTKMQHHQHTMRQETMFYFLSTLPCFEADTFKLSSSTLLCGYVTLG